MFIKRNDLILSHSSRKIKEKLFLDSLESDNSVLNLTKLITEKDELKIKNMSKSPYGIVIVVGPTGSGKSTTLYSMLVT